MKKPSCYVLGSEEGCANLLTLTHLRDFGGGGCNFGLSIYCQLSYCNERASENSRVPPPLSEGPWLLTQSP